MWTGKDIARKALKPKMRERIIRELAAWIYKLSISILSLQTKKLRLRGAPQSMPELSGPNAKPSAFSCPCSLRKFDRVLQDFEFDQVPSLLRTSWWNR